MKNSWMISLITSFVLLGGVLLSPTTSANAAKEATSTYSDQSYSEEESEFSEDFADDLELDDAEQELTKDQKDFKNTLNKYLVWYLMRVKQSTRWVVWEVR